MNTAICKIWLFICIASIMQAQKISHFTTVNGLPSNECYSSISDNNNFTWIATEHGISRFDGYTFKNYDRKDGLKDNTIFSMQCLPNGEIWALSLSGQIFIYRPEIDTFEEYKYNEILKKNISTITNQFYVDYKYNQLVVSNKALGIIYINNNNGEYSNKIYRDTCTNFKFGDQYFLSVFIDHTKGFTANIDGNTFFIKANNFNKIHLPSIFKNEDGTYVFYGLGTLYHIDGGKILKQKKCSQVLNFFKVNDKIAIIDNQSKGVKIYNSVEDIFLDKFTLLLKDITISSIRVTSEGKIWITTLDEGLFLLTSFQNLEMLGQHNDLSEPILAIQKWKNDQLLIGFRNGRLALYDVIHKSLKYFKDTFNLFYEIRAIDENNFIVCDHESSFLMNESGKIRELKIYTKLKGNSPIVVKDININADKNTACLSNHQGLAVLNLNTFLFEQEGFLSKEIQGGLQRVFSSYKDQSGQIWAGTVSGLMSVKNNNMMYDKFSKSSNFRVENIHPYNDTSIVYSTKGSGLYLRGKHSHKKINGSIELDKALMIKLLVTKDQTIYAASASGLFVIRQAWSDKPIIKKYNENNGLISDEIIDIEMVGSQLFTASIRGLGILNKLTSNTSSPSPIIFDISSKGVVRNKTNTFKHYDNDIDISFTTVNYSLLSKILYRYRLNNKRWYSTYERKITLHNLNPGLYELDIQSQDEFGQWSKESTSTIIILKPWWQTYIFYGFAFILLSLIVYYIYKSRIKVLKERYDMNQKIKELEMSALQAQMNPHFVFNCLNSIQTYIMSHDNENATNYLSKFSRLIRKVLDTSVSKKISLQQEIDLLEHYLSLEQMRFKNKFTFEIHVDHKIDKYYTFITPFLIQPVVENAVVHALKDKYIKGVLIINFELENPSSIKVTVTDNGPGFKQKSIEIDGEHRSIGLSNVKQRLELLNENPHEKIIHIRNLANSKNEICGTEVVLYLNID